MTAPIDEARLRELAEADHAVIGRCVERQPKLYMRGQHEGYYVHSDVADLIDIIGRMSDALSAERERGDRAVGLLRRAAGIAMVDGWATREMTRNARDTVDEAHAFLATQRTEGAET